MGGELRGLALALLLSLLIHSLLLSLTLGGQGFGLPGFALPWRERRIEVPELRMVLVPARITAAEPAPLASVEQPGGPGAAEAKPPLRAAGPGDAAPASITAPSVMALDRTDEPAFVVPSPSSVPAPVVAPSPIASSPQAVRPVWREAVAEVPAQIDPPARERAVELAELERSELEARRQAEQLEAARIEALRLESERQETARVTAARQEAAVGEAARQVAVQEAARQAALQEAARQAAVQAEAMRLEAERQETARVAAARQEAAAREAARQAAARAEVARLETERQETARRAAARQEEALQEAARQEAARIKTTRLEAERQEDARREAARRAMGRLLDEEAAQREAASSAARLPGALPPSGSGARRGRLFGRTDPNAELILYAEALARKIQLNMTFEMVREAAKRPHTDPVVTLAIRRDGSVESVTFVVSSGVAEIDETIRRIVQSQLPYQAFPPELAREFDVIEIRRTWHFDTAIRLY